MGNAQVKTGEEPSHLCSEYHALVYRNMLASYKLFKVMQCVHEREEIVVVKMFVHRDGAPSLKDVQRKTQQFKAALNNHYLFSNVVPYQGMEIASRSAILLRQHFARNLYDRMHTRPFLTEVAKNWVAFQVLCSICQSHSIGMTHGDLKTENVFVTSWNHIILTDFAWFKPLFLQENDPSEFSFYFESNLSRHRCYLAPERFDDGKRRSSSASFDRFSRELEAMDVFSLGCVLAEIFLNGQTLMSLPQLLSYKANVFDLSAKIAEIKNEAARELISSMLTLDPTRRRPATNYLREWCRRAIPTSFCSCLFPLSVLLMNPLYQQSDMRILLIRRNFANILWSIVGATRVGAAMFEEQAEEQKRRHGGESAAAVTPLAGASLKEAWSSHVERHVRPTDEMSLHGAMSSAAQMAAQWNAGAPTASDKAAAGKAPERSSAEGRSGRPRLAQPLLSEEACKRFTDNLFNYWEEGRRRCVDADADVQAPEADPGIYDSFLAELCKEGSAEKQDVNLQGEAMTRDLSAGSEKAATDDEDGLTILCGIICSCVQHLSGPRLRIICLDMFVQIAPFASQSVILEQLVPYTVMLMTDPVSRVRARAIDALSSILGHRHIGQLPPSDAQLFLEYLFPQLTSALSGMPTEPVVLLAVAKNIGILARHAVHFAELSQPGAGGSGAAAGGIASPDTPSGESKPAADQPVEVESFDVQCKHLREALKKLVKLLLESCDSHHGAPSDGDESLLTSAMGREIKITLLNNLCGLAEVFGREGTHNFVLPYHISFMNDPAWEVRAAFCREAAKLPQKVGQVSTEGIIWPCFEQALRDQEERVLRAALAGLVVLISQGVLKRQSLVTVASRAAPLLVHPSASVRELSLQAFEALAAQMSLVDQHVFVMPFVRPFLIVDVVDLNSLSAKLVQPLRRPVFKQVVLRRDEELHEALLNKTALPERAEEQADMGSLELLRPYAQLLLRGRPAGAGPQHYVPHDATGDGGLHNMVGAAPTLLQSVHYSTVNPQCQANRSLQAMSEADAGVISPAALGSSGLQHPLRCYSTQSVLAQALCLPPENTKQKDLGSLSTLDGTPYSIYQPAHLRYDAPFTLHQDQPPSARQEPFRDTPERADTGLMEDLVVTGLPGVAAMAASGAADARRGAEGGFFPPQRTSGGSTSSSASTWKPKGVLLATLYEYAHNGGMPVVKVDTTDDSRLLIAGGKDGVVKIWNCAALETDVAVAASDSFEVPAGDGSQQRRRQRLRTLRTIRDSKAFAVGCESGDVLLYKIENSRTGAVAKRKSTFAAGNTTGACAVRCLDQFDTELESLIIFAQQQGKVQAWDVRSCSPSWTLGRVPPWLGVPSCMALGADGHSITIGTLAGGLVLYDLRFRAPWQHWRLSTGAAVLSLRSTSSSLDTLAALGGDSNEVALFDVARGSCSGMFLSEAGDASRDAAVRVPSLLPVDAQADGLRHTVGAEQLQHAIGSSAASSSRRGASAGAAAASGCVRSLWLPSRGLRDTWRMSYFLAAGTDRKVRRWSLLAASQDSPSSLGEQCYVVTPQDLPGGPEREPPTSQPARSSYSSNVFGDVWVVQESPSKASAEAAAKAAAKGDADTKTAGVATNANHRDAILDMCTISLQHDILVTAGRDGLVKLWK
eukprot:TRINITY_DN34615_c0_g2_i1.p1 TRINITY_DN34615_c0_g2~~TRINITY_DN34615_c0_g2_i1.p1  ORF type:complete len:1635 (-),score=353.36 TRINITY_DN34615_c0_g2_i1:105-5009(-)